MSLKCLGQAAKMMAIVLDTLLSLEQLRREEGEASAAYRWLRLGVLPKQTAW